MEQVCELSEEDCGFGEQDCELSEEVCDFGEQDCELSERVCKLMVGECYLLDAYQSLLNYICDMKQNILRLLFFCVVFQGTSQVARDTIQTQNDSITVVDDKYREDQFYFSVTYNLLAKSPNGLAQQGFSSGFHLGFIRDFPFNERRNWAVGVGLGLSSNSYNQNMLIAEKPGGGYDYGIIDEDSISYNKNKFTTYMVEMPFELRWRTSTAKEYQFWRIYTGFKVSYVFYNSSKFEGDIGKIRNSNISDMNGLRYGLTFSVGYSTWNAHIYYGLNSIFDKTAIINGEQVDMRSVKIGLMFYIL